MITKQFKALSRITVIDHFFPTDTHYLGPSAGKEEDQGNNWHGMSNQWQRQFFKKKKR